MSTSLGYPHVRDESLARRVMQLPNQDLGACQQKGENNIDDFEWIHVS